MGLPKSDLLSQLSLPPGFRFYPTDEELMVQYLCRKVAGLHFSLQVIGDIDLYKFDPWDLPSKAIFGEKEWYFFSPRDRKYPNGSRPNRVAGSGYWKATGTDKVITTQGRRVGIKKALVFYVGKAPKGSKTNWIMHEYRLSEPSRKDGSTKLDDWVLCRIYKKSSGAQKPISGVPAKEYSHGSSSSSSSQFDDMLESLQDVNDRLFALPRLNSLRTTQHEERLNLQNLSSGNLDWASLAGVGTMPELGPGGGGGGGQVPAHQTQGHLISNNNTGHDMYVASIPQACLVEVPRQKFARAVEEEVQSGIGAQRVENSAYNSNAFTQGLFNSLDPFGIGYPSPAGQFGFRQ